MAKWAGVEVADGHIVGDRETYEDRSLALELPADRSLWGFHAVVAVADGMGGHNAGDIAAEAAIETLREIAGGQRGQTASFDATSIREGARGALSQAVRLANSRIFGLAAEADALSQMGTTMTVAGLQQDKVVIAHAGDTRAYSIRHDGIRQLTEDHSWVAEQVRTGTMTPEEARRSPMRNQITRTVGTKQSVEPDVVEMKVQGDEIILVCSDGLVECLSDAEIDSIVRSSRSIDDACQRLLDAAQRAGPQDNVTVAAMEIGLFFNLYGAGVPVSRRRRTAEVASARPSRQRAGSRLHTAIFIASVIIAAFGLGILMRLGWHAIMGHDGETATEEEAVSTTSVVDTPRAQEPPTSGNEAQGLTTLTQPAGTHTVAVEVSIESRQETFVLTLLSARHCFADVKPRKRQGVEQNTDHRITYTFEYASSKDSLAEHKAWLLFGTATDDPDASRWDAGTGPVELTASRALTCYYHSKKKAESGEDPLPLFDFMVLPV